MAESVGIPRFKKKETGTAIAVLSPSLVTPYTKPDHEAAGALAESLTTWFWPRMTAAPDGKPWISFEVFYEGRSVAVPHPKDVEPFRTMAAHLSTLVAGGNIPDGGERHAITSEKPKAVLGALSVSPLSSAPQPAAWKSLAIEGHVLGELMDPAGGGPRCHHIALMRAPWQVVRQGPLADAIGTLLGRVGLAGKESRVPDVLAVTQGAPQPFQPAHVLAILRAIRLGNAVTMDYRPLGKPPHAVTAQPVKLVLVDGEPYLWAWDGAAKKLKNYKVARVEVVTCRSALPDVPLGLESEVRTNLLGSFRGVAGAQQRGRVVVSFTSVGVPHVRLRKLGGNQTWQDLPDGGARVSFNTSGMDAVKHWLLQWGAEATVESPAALVAWFECETQRMTLMYKKIPN